MSLTFNASNKITFLCENLIKRLIKNGIYAKKLTNRQVNFNKSSIGSYISLDDRKLYRKHYKKSLEKTVSNINKKERLLSYFTLISIYKNIDLNILENKYKIKNNVLEKLFLKLRIQIFCNSVANNHSFSTKLNLTKPPIITIMGHVDHGKTSLIRAIKNVNTFKEQGDITQHIDAYTVYSNRKKIVFLDTPGHKFFTGIRYRGAAITNIVILVIAVNDCINQQTIESIKHAKNASVPILVAINKIDLPFSKNIDKIYRELVQYDLVPKEWGGSTHVLKISAHKKTGLQYLLQSVVNRSIQMNLTYNTQDQAQGVVLDTYMDKGKGLVTSLLVKSGVLSINSSIIILNNAGKIRSMFNTEYSKISYATSSMNVNVTGLIEVSKAGDIFYTFCAEKRIKNMSSNNTLKDINISTPASIKFSRTLSNKLNYIVKTDTYGSLEAITQGLILINKEYEVNIINLVYGNIGNVNESDINLALITKSNILSFNVQTSHKEKNLTKKENIVTENYKLIYNLLHDVSTSAKKLISTNDKNIYLGKARVEKVFNTSLERNILGCYVLSGKIIKDSIIKIFRNKKFIEECKIDNLKRFKNDVSQIDKGLECGIVLSNRIKIEVNDTLECYSI